MPYKEKKIKVVKRLSQKEKKLFHSKANKRSDNKIESKRLFDLSRCSLTFVKQACISTSKYLKKVLYYFKKIKKKYLNKSL
jgi:hypothetical protein